MFPVIRDKMEKEKEKDTNSKGRAAKMTGLTVIENAAVAQQVQEVTSLFSDFIAFIDRGEKTTRTYITNLKQFAAWMKYAGILQPQRPDIILYRQWLESEHEAVAIAPELPEGWKYRTDRAGNVVIVKCRPNTVKAYMQSVKQFFSWTAAEGLYPNIAANVHTAKIKTDEHKKEALTAQQVLEIENSIISAGSAAIESAQAADKDKAGRVQRTTEQNKRLYAMYLLAVNAGLRTVEISRANVRDFVTKGGQSWLYIYGKGHAEADTKKALAPEVAAAIKDYLQSRKDKPTAVSPLFVSTGNRSHGQRIATTTISTMLKKAMQEAGYNDERLTAHSLRHTAGNCVMDVTNNNIYDTQTYMRHASPKTTEIYLHRDTEKADAQTAAKLYDYYHGKESAEPGRLDDLLKRLNPVQLQQLEGIAAAMATA